MARILFLGGPSGAGKTYFATQYLAQHGWQHIEIDRFPECDGIESANLRSEWNQFFTNFQPEPLFQELIRRFGHGTHLVLSFPSLVTFRPQHLKAGAGYFYFAYLYGEPSHCLKSFLSRERAIGSGFGAEYWDRFAPDSFGKLSLSWNQPLLINAFLSDGSRRDCDAIYLDVRELISDV